LIVTNIFDILHELIDILHEKSGKLLCFEKNNIVGQLSDASGVSSVKRNILIKCN